MSVRATRRHVLFLAALGLPCVFLVSVGIILLNNGQELAQARVGEERRRQVTQVGSELLADLERIKLEEAGAMAARNGAARPGSAPRTEVAMIGWIRDGD